MEKISCSCGYLCDVGSKFCPNCGAVLNRDSAAEKVSVPEEQNTVTSSIGFFNPFTMSAPPLPAEPESTQEPINVFPEDKGLTLMVDCCSKNGPLPMGESYNESVLYLDETSGEYQIHQYASNGMGESSHRAYRTGKEHAERVLAAIDEERLKSDFLQSVTGGSRVLKYRDREGTIKRYECNLGEAAKALSAVWSLLEQGVQEENRIVPEYAASWKYFSVTSTGMSKEACYRYELDRSDPERVLLRGRCFLAGVDYELSCWHELDKEECAELAKIPLGLMLSKAAPARNPAAAGFCVPFMADAGSCSCTVTYGDDRSDTKISDTNMLARLNGLVKKVFKKA